MWNVIDFVTNSLYVATVALRLVAYNQVRHQQCTARTAGLKLREIPLETQHAPLSSKP
jgi:transient receptor potential cation channel subfamily C